ncbi:MAG: hypothetical protein MUF27_03640 [Acidobacteria bacterium]|jgi:hypothetical protein|nr:hypothetical protein [Acidobacteriota bacterium]
MNDKIVNIPCTGVEVHEDFVREQATAGLPVTDDDWSRFLLGDETA